jgi:NAD(P)-dependent dehydrogenase (short-subunit alcohol dehydrogenase family)
MYGTNDESFINFNRPFLQSTPLATPRKEHEGDKTEYYESVGGRPAYSEEVAGTVGMLCLPDAAWTTGSVICANGGMRFSF